MSQSKLETAFEAGAIKFNVSESDYLVLKCHGYSCFEDFYYRLPTKEDLEKYFQEILHKVGAYRDRTSGGFSTYTKASPDWDTWKRSDDAACLRKLWTYGSSLCKTEMEDMTGGGSEKIRMTHAAAAELERKAIKNGMAPPGSDTERPSLWTLQKLANNHGLSGKHVHLEWESYVSMEQEEKSSRTGKGLKTKPAVFLVGGKHLEVQDQELELDGVQKITGLVTLREVLNLRARSFAMLELTEHSLLNRLHEKYFSLARQTTPDKMRSPTINEIRKFDREIFKQALRWKAEKQGEVGDCISYYLDTPAAGLWKMLEPVPESHPDQGLEREEKSKADGAEKGDNPNKRKAPEDSKENADAEKPARKCIVCGKRHEPRCVIPPGWRREQKDKQKKAKEANRERAKAADKEKKSKA